MTGHPQLASRLSTRELRINAGRLANHLAEIAQIGGLENGGCNRQALTQEDAQGRQWFIDHCLRLGGEVRRDQMGNLFVRWAGREALPPVLMGSHLDTQPTGGKYDGVYGVLSALEVMTCLHEAGITTRYPLEIAVWTNEEGARFAPAMMGSGVFAGVFDQEAMLAVTDRHGIAVGEALASSQQRGDHLCAAYPLTAALELHIEQGPVLEAEGKTIGVVQGVQGMSWFDVSLRGVTTHAGPTPMAMRHDPVAVLGPLLGRLYETVRAVDHQARLTIGEIRVHPGSRNTVPGEVVFSVDLRHPEQPVLDHLIAQVHELIARADGQYGVQARITPVWHSPAVQFDGGCLAAIQAASDQLGLTAMPMVSGAGHDSVYLARVAPVGMIFIPCAGGISHNEAEAISLADMAAGANVLLHSVLQLAGPATASLEA